jgi:hypothetical protein
MRQGGSNFYLPEIHAQAGAMIRRDTFKRRWTPHDNDHHNASIRHEDPTSINKIKNPAESYTSS